MKCTIEHAQICTHTIANVTVCKRGVRSRCWQPTHALRNSRTRYTYMIVYFCFDFRIVRQLKCRLTKNILHNLPNTITPPSRNTETSTKRVRQELHDRQRTYTHTHQHPDSDSTDDFNKRTENTSHISHNDEARDESRRKVIDIRPPYMDANET